MNVKKILALVFSLLLCVSAFVSCAEDEPPKETVYYTVTLDYNGAKDNETVKVKEGGLVTRPADPERENYIFNGWKKDGINWDFDSNTVNSDITISAVWVSAASIFKYTVNPDGESITITQHTSSFSEIRVPSKISGYTVTAIGNNVFSGLDFESVNLVSLPETVTSVGDLAFSGCAGIKIVVNGALTHVGAEAFLGCDKLESISFSDSLTQISHKAFSGCTGLSTVTLPANTALVGENAFEYCTGIKTVLLCSKNATLEDSAFTECSGLVTVFFLGVEQELSLSIAHGNESFSEAKMYFYSESEPVSDGSFWYFDSNNKPRCWVK